MSDWETFCDVGYYHMWRLRRGTERGWKDGFHINTKAEAEALCKMLNKLEGDLDDLGLRLAEAEADRDKWKEKFIQQNRDLGCEMMDPGGTIWDHASQLQVQLGEAKAKIERQAERIRYLEGATNHACGTPLSIAKEEIRNWETKWKCAVEMAAKAENERDEIRSDLEFRRELYKLQEDRMESLREQLDAAIMLGRLQERRHQRELEQVHELYRLNEAARRLIEPFDQ